MGDLPLLLMISHDIYPIYVHKKGLSIKAGMSARLYENWSCCAHARHCQFERVEDDWTRRRKPLTNLSVTPPRARRFRIIVMKQMWEHFCEFGEI